MSPVICLVTSGLLQRSAWSRFVEHAQAAAESGVALLQLREPHLEGGALFDLAQATVEAVRGTRTRVLVNERLDVAVSAGAHGVHLRGQSMPAARARHATPRGFLIGRSIRTAEDARAAALAGGCDYLIFGTVFTTASKPGMQAAGTDRLADVVRATTLPVLAVGGMTIDRLGEVGSAGAAGFAAISLFDSPTAAGIGSIVRSSREAFAAASGR